MTDFSTASTSLAHSAGRFSKKAAEIVLATANARFSHTSLALRYLMANLGDLADRAVILELTIDDKAQDIAEKVLARQPRVVALSVYLWNVALLTEVAALIKRLRPEVRIVLGGPEVSFDTSGLDIVRLADHVVSGEGESAFRQLAAQLLDERETPEKHLTGGIADPGAIALPYHLYTPEDISHRVIYIEASRGCPFGCEFCLSGQDKKVRRFEEERILEALSTLYHRGARKFKFIDRSLHLAISPAILDFFLEKQSEPLFVHFELVPDRLPQWAFQRLKSFPEGAVQLEAGVQTLNDAVARRIGRKTHTERALENLKALRQQTGVHIHSDLIVGLPGEDLASFTAGFDRLFAVGLQEIQIGILKRLRGAAIARHDAPFGMLYNPRPPYDILQNDLIDFHTMQRLKRFAKVFDLVCNRGNFNAFVPLIKGGASPFDRLLALSDWLHERIGRTHAVALNRLAELLFEHVTTHLGIEPSEAANRLYADFVRTGHRSFPGSVERYVTVRPRKEVDIASSHLPERQRRHRR